MNKHTPDTKLRCYPKGVRCVALFLVTISSAWLGAGAGVVVSPMDDGGSQPGLWSEIHTEVYASPHFNPTASGGENPTGTPIHTTANWSGSSYVPGHHIGVEEGPRSSTNLFTGKSQAGFNNAGVSLLRNYVSFAGLPTASGGDPDPLRIEAWSYGETSHQFRIGAPAGFWDLHDDYLLAVTFDVSGTLSKSANTNLSLVFGANPGIDLPGGQEWYFDYGAADGEMVDVAFAETLEAQWSMRWNEWGGEPGVFCIGHSVDLYMESDNSGSFGFSGEADFFDTSGTSTITLLTQTGSDQPVEVVTFDNLGNVIAGGTEFSLQMPIPEPATFALLIGVIALGGVAFRRLRFVKA